MMAYLTRPGFNGGGSVSNRNVLPKRKPAEEVKKRKKINYEKLKQYLGEESRELIERELGLAIGGAVETPKRGLVDEPGSYAGDYGKFINEIKSGSKNIIGFDVEGRNKAYVDKPYQKSFLISEYGSAEEALKAAKANRDKVFYKYLSNEKFMQLRKEKINLNNSQFADYLNNETDFVPSSAASKGKGTGKWTKSNVKTKMGFLSKTMPEFADVKSKFVVPKKEVPTDIADKIYKEYLQADGS